jgi:hypothetical protein
MEKYIKKTLTKNLLANEDPEFDSCFVDEDSMMPKNNSIGCFY